MPAYWDPWPGNMNTTSRSLAGLLRLTVVANSGLRSAAAASDTSEATTTARCANALRPDASVHATSARLMFCAPSRKSASCVAAVPSAAGERADSASSWGPSSGSEAGSAGACSSTTCALVPPTPNELTPARSGPFASLHSLMAALTTNGVVGKSMAGLGRSKCRLGGSRRSLSDSAVLITPAAPAAITRCPKLLLTEPILQKPLSAVPLSAVPRRNAFTSPSISIGSPIGVAVPCASR